LLVIAPKSAQVELFRSRSTDPAADCLLAPELPPDIRVHVLGVELHRIEHDARASMTSLPIPSPGIHAILYFAIASSFESRKI
jgi:hypothetical protein